MSKIKKDWGYRAAWCLLAIIAAAILARPMIGASPPSRLHLAAAVLHPTNKELISELDTACFSGYWLHYGLNIDIDTRRICHNLDSLMGKNYMVDWENEPIGIYRNDKSRDFILNHDEWIQEQRRCIP